jgi:hypothetical protein
MIPYTPGLRQKTMTRRDPPLIVGEQYTIRFARANANLRLLWNVKVLEAMVRAGLQARRDGV